MTIILTPGKVSYCFGLIMCSTSCRYVYVALTFYLHVYWSLYVTGEITLTEPGKRVASTCFGGYINASCEDNPSSLILIYSVQYVAKPKSSGCPGTNNCCTYEQGDCAGDTDKGYEACMGKQTCDVGPGSQVERISTNDFPCNAQSAFPSFTEFLTMDYFCIPDNRRWEMCSSSVNQTVEGMPVYLLSRNYPTMMTSVGADCTCSIETDVCDAEIRFFIFHLSLTETNGECQQFQLSDGNETAMVVNCTSNTNYTRTETIRKTSYLKVEVPSGPGGFFWLGFQATTSDTRLYVECPAPAERRFCATKGVDLGESCATDLTYCNHDNAVCSEAGVCVCEEGFYQDATACVQQASLGAGCTHVSECRQENARCENGTCQCPSSYFNNNGVCSQEVDLGGACAVVGACLSVNAVCTENVCTCANENYQENTTCIHKIELGETCASSVTCLSGNCSNSTCVCKADLVQGNDGTCVCKADLVQGNDGTCVCKDDLVQGNNGTCVSAPETGTTPSEPAANQEIELGETCASSVTCLSGNCSNSTCVCKADMVQGNDGTCACKADLVQGNDGTCVLAPETGTSPPESANNQDVIIIVLAVVGGVLLLLLVVVIVVYLIILRKRKKSPLVPDPERTAPEPESLLSPRTSSRRSPVVSPRSSQKLQSLLLNGLEEQRPSARATISTDIHTIIADRRTENIPKQTTGDDDLAAFEKGVKLNGTKPEQDKDIAPLEHSGAREHVKEPLLINEKTRSKCDTNVEGKRRTIEKQTVKEERKVAYPKVVRKKRWTKLRKSSSGKVTDSFNSKGMSEDKESDITRKSEASKMKHGRPKELLSKPEVPGTCRKITRTKQRTSGKPEDQGQTTVSESAPNKTISTTKTDSNSAHVQNGSAGNSTSLSRSPLTNGHGPKRTVTWDDTLIEGSGDKGSTFPPLLVAKVTSDPEDKKRQLMNMQSQAMVSMFFLQADKTKVDEIEKKKDQMKTSEKPSAVHLLSFRSPKVSHDDLEISREHKRKEKKDGKRKNTETVIKTKKVTDPFMQMFLGTEEKIKVMKKSSHRKKSKH